MNTLSDEGGRTLFGDARDNLDDLIRIYNISYELGPVIVAAIHQHGYAVIYNIFYIIGERFLAVDLSSQLGADFLVRVNIGTHDPSVDRARQVFECFNLEGGKHALKRLNT